MSAFELPCESNFSSSVFKMTQPSVIRQGEWVGDSEFTRVLIESWTRQYAEYLGDKDAEELVRTLTESKQLFDHDDSLTLLSTIGDEKVGIGALRQIGQAGGITLITMLEVLDTYQGQGIGGQLLEALATRKINASPSPLVAHVSIHRPCVKQFYLACGFIALKREFVDHGGHCLEFDVLARQSSRMHLSAAQLPSAQ